MQTATRLGYNLIPLPVTPQCFHEVEVTYHQFKVKNKPFEVPFLGDIHWSSQECLEDFALYARDRIKRTHKTLVMVMGDAGEFNDDKSPGYAIHEQKYTNQQTKDFLTFDYFKPIRRKIGIFHDGNHDGTRSRVKVGTSQTRDMAIALDVPYSKISCYNIIDFNDHRIIIYTNHGKKRGTPTLKGTETKTKKERLVYNAADIVAIGHVHRCVYNDIKEDDNITENIIIDYENMEMKQVPATFPKRLITGHFLRYLGGYGQEDGYPPNPAGYPVLKLYKDGQYDVEFIMERDWRKGIL